MPTPLNERFCLKGTRRNFTVSFRQSSEDRAAYFGKGAVNTTIIESIRERYMLGSQPKKYLYGQYGVGKSHTLYNIKYHLEESPEAKANTAYTVRCRPIDAEFREKTSYNYLHAQMMEAVTLEAARQVVEQYLATNAGSGAREQTTRGLWRSKRRTRNSGIGICRRPDPLVEVAMWRDFECSRAYVLQLDQEHGHGIRDVSGSFWNYAAICK